MADTKITDLTAYGTEHGDDVFPVVDVHDTTMAGSGTDKKATVNQVFGAPTSGQLVYWSGSATGTPAGAAHAGIGPSGQLAQSAITPSPLTDGDNWYDSGRLCHARQANGMTVYGVGLIYAQIANVSVTAGPTSFVGTTGALGTPVLPAGFLNVTGKAIHIRAGGYVFNNNTGNSQLQVKLGSTIVASTTAYAMALSALQSWSAECTIVCKATGASGKLDCFGFYQWKETPVVGFMNWVGGVVAPNTQVTLDLTAGYTIDFIATIGGASNTLTCSNLQIFVQG